MTILSRPVAPVRKTQGGFDLLVGGSMPPQDPQRRRVEILKAVADAGGSLVPARDPRAANGYSFAGLGEGAAADLAYLAQRDYLTEKFFDRVSLCPKCSSHEINVREVCPSCGSAHLNDEPLLHHFRCGFVGPVSAFATEGQKRVCPKCNGRMEHLGTDHDRLGKAYTCADCATSFQDPPVAAMCFACGTTTPAEDLVHADMHSYSLTSLGVAAARRGSLYEQDEEFLYLGDLPIYRPTVFLELIEQEAKRVKRFKSPFSVLMVNCNDSPVDLSEDGPVAAFLRELRSQLREIDLLGQVSDRSFAVLLPGTDAKGARVVERRLSGGTGRPNCSTAVVAVTRQDDIAVLEGALSGRR